MREKVYHYGTMLVLLLALVIGMLGTAKADAAVPAKPSVSLTKRTKTTAAIKIKKKGKVSGYQVYMKSSKSGKYQLIMGMKTSTYTIKKLKANKTYYVKVRAFRTRGYHITFGKYSSVLKIKPYKKPEPSQTPEPSDSPEPSVSPGSSMDPNASASPEPFVGPDASSSPDSSAVPDASASPEASGTPQPA